MNKKDIIQFKSIITNEIYGFNGSHRNIHELDFDPDGDRGKDIAMRIGIINGMIKSYNIMMDLTEYNSYLALVDDGPNGEIFVELKKRTPIYDDGGYVVGYDTEDADLWE